jgi:hypothetical protein
MKKKKQVKQVTLPLGNKKVFEKLAQIAWRVEKESIKGNPERGEKEEFFDHVLQELGKDAFLYSFTPSGEIGDGLNTLDNPQTPRIAKSFYEDGLEDLFGPGGEITKFFKRGNPSDAVQKNRLMRYKSAIVALVQLYLESAMKYKIRDKVPKDSTDAEKMRERVTSFNYTRRKSGMTDEEWYLELIRVEMNKYTRLFVAALFFSSISNIFLLKISDLTRSIDTQDLAGINSLNSNKKKYAKLRNEDNRKDFVKAVLNMWRIPISKPKVKKKESRKEVVQPTIDEQMKMIDLMRK